MPDPFASIAKPDPFASIAKPITQAPSAPADLPTPAGITPSMALGMQALSQNPKTRGVTLQSSTIPKPPAIPYSDPVNRAIIGTAAKVASGIPSTLPQVGSAYLGAMDLASGGGVTALRRGRQYDQQSWAGNAPTAAQIVRDARDDIAGTVGLDPDAIREAATNRDWSSIVSETLPAVVAGSAMGRAGTIAPEAGMTIGKAPTTLGLSRVLDRAVLGNQAPEGILTRALKPPVSYPEFEAVVANRLPEIVGQVNKSGQPIKGVKGFTGAVDELAAEKGQAYRDIIAPFRQPTALENGLPVRAAGPYQPLMVNTTPVAEAQMRSIPATDILEQPNRQTYIQRGSYGVLQGDPGIIQKTAEKAAPYRGEMPIDQADAIRIDTNAKLNSFYNKAGGDQFAALSNPETARLKAVNDTIRDSVYNKLSDATGVDPRPIQNAFGDYTDLGKVAGKRGTVYSRQQPIPLQEQISAADALARGNPMKFALAKIFSRYGNSDILTRIALDRANPLRPPGVQPLRVNAPNLGGTLVLGIGNKSQDR